MAYNEIPQQLRRRLGQRVFSKQAPAGAGAPAAEEPGWRESLYRVYKSGHQSMRVAIYGCKHDAALFEEMLQACPAANACCRFECCDRVPHQTRRHPRLQARRRAVRGAAAGMPGRWPQLTVVRIHLEGGVRAACASACV